jgi:hypothetical protein
MRPVAIAWCGLITLIVCAASSRVDAGGAAPPSPCVLSVVRLEGPPFSGTLTATESAPDPLVLTLVATGRHQSTGEIQTQTFSVLPGFILGFPPLDRGETLTRLRIKRIREILLGSAGPGHLPHLCFDSDFGSPGQTFLTDFRSAVILTAVNSVSQVQRIRGPDGPIIRRNAQVQGIVVPIINLAPFCSVPFPC